MKPCTDCGHPTRPKSIHAAHMPGTRIRVYGRCKPCHRDTQLLTGGATIYGVKPCEGCGKLTRDQRENLANAPGTRIRNGAKCSGCDDRHKARPIPEGDTRHNRTGLEAWLEARRKRIGATE